MYVWHSFCCCCIFSRALADSKSADIKFTCERKTGGLTSISGMKVERWNCRTERKKLMNSSTVERYLSIRASRFDFSKMAGKSFTLGTAESYRSNISRALFASHVMTGSHLRMSQLGRRCQRQNQLARPLYGVSRRKGSRHTPMLLDPRNESPELDSCKDR